MFIDKNVTKGPELPRRIACVAVTDAIFERRGDHFAATDLARGPWDPNAQHGGAPAALLGGELEQLEPQPHLRIVRITYELLRPVPLGELYVQSEITRPGKRVQLLEASLNSPDGTALVKARALRVARAPLGAGTPAQETPAGPETLATATATPWEPDSLPGGAVELRYAEGRPDQLGPRTVWFRLKVPVVAGERPTPLQRLLVAADFPNGIANELDWQEWVFINPDLTVYVERDPIGEWVALQARTRITANETALAQAALFDTHGRVGQALQSLYVARATSA